MSTSSRHVRVENVTQGTIVADNARVASSSRDRNVGLLRTPEVKPGEGLWIERSPSIHMFFMAYAIDAIFVSKAMRVTRVVANLRPWRVVLWARGAKDCLELRAGWAAESGTQAGDELRLVDLDAEDASQTSRATAKP
ncbi:MAG: DUF192 domain-containing protein [Candidatus Limnocylindria bacterium]